MQKLHYWQKNLHRVIGFSCGTPQQRIHCKWADMDGTEHEMEWINYTEWLAWNDRQEEYYNNEIRAYNMQYQAMMGNETGL